MIKVTDFATHCEIIVSCNLSVQFSHSVVSDSLQPHGLPHVRLPCPSPTPGAFSNSCPLSRWCHSAIWSYVVPFSPTNLFLFTTRTFQTEDNLTSRISVCIYLVFSSRCYLTCSAIPYIYCKLEVQLKVLIRFRVNNFTSYCFSRGGTYC